mmetsp:Transcript_57390/g.132223  ORF Transcript_57390/g.132223 Transcript_57390/m.132223 type:complete len:205 (-) Transcript_57390:173-787(-)
MVMKAVREISSVAPPRRSWWMIRPTCSKLPSGRWWERRNLRALVSTCSSTGTNSFAAEKTFTTYAVSQVEASLSDLPNAENPPLSWRYVSSLCTPVCIFFRIFVLMSPPNFPEALRFWATYTLGARPIMVCSPHPVGTWTSSSRWAMACPSTSPTTRTSTRVDRGAAWARSRGNTATTGTVGSCSKNPVLCWCGWPAGFTRTVL